GGGGPCAGGGLGVGGGGLVGAGGLGGDCRLPHGGGDLVGPGGLGGLVEGRGGLLAVRVVHHGLLGRRVRLQLAVHVLEVVRGVARRDAGAAHRGEGDERHEDARDDAGPEESEQCGGSLQPIRIPNAHEV